MLGIDARAARATWTVASITALLLVAYLVRRTLLIFTAALLLAYLLSPLVSLVQRLFSGKVSRNLSLAVVYMLLVALLVSGGAALGSRIIEQASNLAARLPELLQNAQKLFERPLPAWIEPIKADLQAALQSQLEQGAKAIVPLLQKTAEQLLSVLGNLVFLLLVPILSFFFLKDARSIRQGFLDQLVQGPERMLLEDIFADVHVLLAQFMRALVLLGSASFVFYGISLGILGVPYALLLATVAGLLEFIPVLGPLVASLIILLVAGFSGYPHLLWILIFMGVYRLFQDYVLQPYLMSSGVELHPLLVIFGALCGEQIGGVPGMFLSVPALATLRVVYVRVQKARQAARTVSANS